MSKLTDLEITRLCAKAMNLQTDGVAPTGTGRGLWALPNGNRQHYVYNPFDDDAQCFALIVRFQLWVGGWLSEMVSVSKDGKFLTSARTLNRAVCECVVKMELAKANV